MIKRQFQALSLLTLFVVSFTGCVCRTDSYVIGDPVCGFMVPIRDIPFSFDSAALTDEARAVLESNARWLTECSPNSSITVEGHCDERGTNEYNLTLGAERARAAVDYLKVLGVNKDRLSVISYGEELPLDSAHSEQAFAKNRRVHFHLY